MTSTAEQISGLLHEAGETHHRVFRIVDGADDDWASWYAQWLIDLSELPDLLGARPVRSELIYLLVGLDKQYTAENPAEPWEMYYARRIAGPFPATWQVTWPCAIRREGRCFKGIFAMPAARRAPRSVQHAAARPRYLSLLHKRHEGHLHPHIWSSCSRKC